MPAKIFNLFRILGKPGIVSTFPPLSRFAYLWSGYFILRLRRYILFATKAPTINMIIRAVAVDRSMTGKSSLMCNT